MANEVFKTPDVYMKETDNTFIRDTNNTVFGTGAITIKANQGPVNQRILFNRFQDFQQVFGKPTTKTDYGHFAARLYMSVAPSLYVVRASYGDESYATIQYPREVKTKYTQLLSAGNPYIKLTTTAEVNDLVELVKIENIYEIDQDYSKYGEGDYVYTSKGVIANEGTYYDMNTKQYAKGVFDEAELDQTYGKYLKLDAYDNTQIEMILNPSDKPVTAQIVNNLPPKSNSKYGETLEKVSADGKVGADLFFFDDKNEFVGTQDDYINCLSYYINTTTNSASTISASGYESFYKTVSGSMFYPISINIDERDTMDGKDSSFQTYVQMSALKDITNFSGDYSETLSSEIKIKGTNSIANSGLSGLYNVSYYNNSADYDSYDVTKLTTPREWDSNLIHNNLIVSGKPFAKENAREVRSITFTQYGMGDTEHYLVAGYAKAEDVASCPELSNKILKDGYGVNAIEADGYTPYILLRTDRYDFTGLPEYTLSVTGVDFGSMCDKLTKLTPEQIGMDKFDDITDWTVDTLLVKGELEDHAELFAVYKDANDKEIKVTSLYDITKPETPTVPVNVENTNREEFGDDKIKETIAIPTNQALIMYPDGYTKTSDTDEEPGIGDLEMVKPWCGSSLVIGAIGPGKYANDLGISITTPDQYDIKALNIPNAFDWRWRFDDEDMNKNASKTEIDKMIAEGSEYKDISNKLTWTQVYKINVYRKPTNKTAEDAWGKGKEALASNIPVESFLVSNDPRLVDGEGESLYAPNVINGKSNFIYISRKSVESMDGKLPKSTLGIFPLVGGVDGTKSGINQKQAALQLYSDPNKANFDLIFNTDAIESFASKEKYKSAQIKFGEIAGTNNNALAIVQVTSKEAKRLSKALAEAKGFSFEYPSFVAMYAGYDKYYDPDLASYIYLPKSIAAAVNEGWIMYNRNPWDVPGGVDDGGIEYTVGNQLLTLNTSDMGELYSNNINYSRTMPIYGECLWGNKTAQKKNTALRSINVRVLMNYVKKNVKNILTPYIFRNNTDTERSRMKNQLTNFLGDIEKRGGLSSPRVKVWCSGEDLMNHIVRVELGFIPPYSIEFIPVNVVLDSASNTIDILEA